MPREALSVNTKSMFKQYLTEKFTLLGYSGSIFYWIFEHYEAVAGIVLSVAMVISSIILHYIKIKGALKKQKREEELHELKMEKARHEESK